MGTFKMQKCYNISVMREKTQVNSRMGYSIEYPRCAELVVFSSSCEFELENGIF